MSISFFNRKAGESHFNAQALFNLGYMHEKGLGMKKDWHLAKRMYDLAAETSTDAKIPVALALLKLSFEMQIEAIRDSPFKFILYLDENIIANWDLYLITILTLFLGLIMFMRRNHEIVNPRANQRETPESNAPADEQTQTPRPQPAPQHHPADVPQ